MGCIQLSKFIQIAYRINQLLHLGRNRMEKAKTAIAKLDRFPASPSFYWNGIKNKQTVVGGLIGLIFIIVTLVMIVSKSINVFDRSEIILDSFTKKDESKVNMSGLQVEFIMFYYSAGSVSTVPFYMYPLFGIEALVVSIELNYTDKNDPRTEVLAYPLEPCASPYLLCAPDIVYEPSCSYDRMDFEVCNYVKEYHIIVTNISDKPPSLEGLYPTLMIFDTKYNLFEKKSSDILKTMPIAINKLPNAFGLDPKLRYLFEVPVSKIELHTEESIMPSALPLFGSPNYTETYFYPNDKLGLGSDNFSFFIDMLPTYFDFYLFRSGFTETYKRSYRRLDSMIAQIFGLVGLISLVFALLCAGYNDWLMKLHVEDSLKNQESDILNGIERKKHYGIFLKEKMQQLSRKICCKSSQTTDPLNEEEEIKKDLDVVHMYHRMRKMEQEIAKLKQKVK